MKVRLGTVLSNKVPMSRCLPHGAPESRVIFRMIMELVLRDLIKSWKVQRLAWSMDDFAVSEVMVPEVTAKLKEVGLTLGAEKTHWTFHPKMMDTSIGVHGLAVLCEEVLEFVGSKVCLGGSGKICDCSQICASEQVSGEMETRSEFIVAFEEVSPEPFSAARAFGQTVGAQRYKISSWSARTVAIVMGVKKPPWTEVDQRWRLWHRTGHRWIETCNMTVLTAIRERVLC